MHTQQQQQQQQQQEQRQQPPGPPPQGTQIPEHQLNQYFGKVDEV